MSHLDSLTPIVSDVLADAKRRLLSRYGGRLREVRLFGSYARGNAGPGSDVDVLIVLDRVRSTNDRTAAMREVIDAGFDRDMIVDAIVLGVDELGFRRRLETAFVRALDEEGIAV